jgi:hypothetical protein
MMTHFGQAVTANRCTIAAALVVGLRWPAPGTIGEYHVPRGNATFYMFFIEAIVRQVI